MHNFMKPALCAIFLTLAVSLPIPAQNYRQDISKNRERAAGVYHYYEYAETPSTPAPKGYEAFYISHYGRHGSRYHQKGSYFRDAISILDSARTLNRLTPEGILLSKQLDTVWQEHQGMFGMLTELGGNEHREIAKRMFDHYRTVFSKERTEVDCVSSYFPRCIISMTNFTTSLLEEACRNAVGGLSLHFVTGPKYMDYLSMNLQYDKELNMLENSIATHLRDSLYQTSRLLDAIFKDKTFADGMVKDPIRFMRQIYRAGSISPNLISHPDIFSHFTDDELIRLWIPENASLYFGFGVSKEAGSQTEKIAKPLIKDFIEKADAAIRSDSRRAADLRFGHDTGILPLIGTIGIKGMEQRWTSATVHEHWASYSMIPMGSNFQMIFYKNKSGDVIVKMLYNEKETTIPAVKAWKGTYYKWNDLREYLLKVMNAIGDDGMVTDTAEKERTGI
ncbi:MAG: hypothetical protein PUK70_05215 [Bacteroidales bacterium]|nr:hypothetical protein [Bacteroidales bacterium]MDY6002479.1 hypothetical protein [Candidatus Cryptobacteroides sp.]